MLGSFPHISQCTFFYTYLLFLRKSSVSHGEKRTSWPFLRKWDNITFLPLQVSFYTDCSADISRDKKGPCRRTEKVCRVRVCMCPHSIGTPGVSGALVSDIKTTSYHMGECAFHQGPWLKIITVQRNRCSAWRKSRCSVW